MGLRCEGTNAGSEDWAVAVPGHGERSVAYPACRPSNMAVKSTIDMEVFNMFSREQIFHCHRFMTRRLSRSVGHHHFSCSNGKFDGIRQVHRDKPFKS